MTAHPERLESFDYRGRHTYHLRFCTHERQPIFSSSAAVDLALQQIQRAATELGFELLAYCFMPDHLHLVVRGCSDTADLKAFASKAKQYSGYAYAQLHKKQLWQRYFYEHVLRSEEAEEGVISYVLMNPVRAGLCETPDEYLFSGSAIYGWGQLREFFREWSSARSG
jgi:putative transposase